MKQDDNPNLLKENIFLYNLETSTKEFEIAIKNIIFNAHEQRILDIIREQYPQDYEDYCTAKSIYKLFINKSNKHDINSVEERYQIFRDLYKMFYNYYDLYMNIISSKTKKLTIKS